TVRGASTVSISSKPNTTVPKAVPFSKANPGEIMLIETVRYCNACNIVIASKERDRVQFEDKDFHNACYRTMLNHFFTEKRALAASARESERSVSATRLMGA